jgi:hypothetical protein
MQVALNDDNVSPLDAALESVMPGVHQRFVAMDGTVKTLDRKIVSGFNKLDTKVDGLADHFTDLERYNQERDAKLADNLQAVAARLGTPVGSPPLFSSPRRPQQVQLPIRGGKTINNLLEALLMLPGTIEWSPSTIRSNPCMTNGMGLETALTSLLLVALQPWRSVSSQNGATTSQLLKKKNFSQSQMVIWAILRTVEETNWMLSTVIKLFKRAYKEEAKLSMAKMATIVQNHGLVTKKRVKRQNQEMKTSFPTTNIMFINSISAQCC